MECVSPESPPKKVRITAKSRLLAEEADDPPFCVSIVQLGGQAEVVGGLRTSDSFDVLLKSSSLAMGVPSAALQLVYGFRKLTAAHATAPLKGLGIHAGAVLTAVITVPERLTRLLRSPAWPERVTACEELSLLACGAERRNATLGDACIRLLRKLLGDVVAVVREAAVESCRQLAEAAAWRLRPAMKVPPAFRDVAEGVAAFLSSRSWDERRLACVVLGSLGCAAAPHLVALTGRCRDESGNVQSAACKSLATLLEAGLRVTSEDLSFVADHAAGCVASSFFLARAEACRVLGAAGAPAAGPHAARLLACFADPCEIVDVSRVAGEALIRLQEAGAALPAEELLRVAQETGVARTECQRQARRMLKCLLDAESKGGGGGGEAAAASVKKRNTRGSPCSVASSRTRVPTTDEARTPQS